MTVKYAYACLVDFCHELDLCEIKIYPSLEGLKTKRPCVKQCGIVKIPMPDYEIIQKPDYSAAIKANQDKNKEK